MCYVTLNQTTIRQIGKSHCPTLEAEDFMSTYVNDILIETCANILIASIVTIVKTVNECG